MQFFAETDSRRYVFDDQRFQIFAYTLSDVEISSESVGIERFVGRCERVEIRYPVLKVFLDDGSYERFSLLTGEFLDDSYVENEFGITVAVRRVITGLGDAVTVEPVMRRLVESGEKPGILTRYPEIFENSYVILNEIPSDVRVIELGEPCPAGEYEYEFNPGIKKGRVQIFLESAGFDYEDDCPKVVFKGKKYEDSDCLRVGVAIVSAKYGTPIDGWRDYPYPKPLLEILRDDFDVYWLHTEPSGVEGVKDVVGDIRVLIRAVVSMDLMITIDSGIAHLAGALGVPQYNLVGPTYPMKLINYPNVKTSREYKACGVQPCWYNPCPGRYCLSTLSPGEILKDIKEMLDDR